jgi:molybdopterin synthase catalytic subunit
MMLGSSSTDLIDLTPGPLGPDGAAKFVTTAAGFVVDPAAGGVAVFVGTTRAEQSPAGQALAALDYEAYADMALEAMRSLAARARERWPIVKLALLHRVGRVAVGEASVVVAVSCGHRAEAFEACRWLIDTLKAEVPIWKKEEWADGSASWVEGQDVRSA